MCLAALINDTVSQQYIPPVLLDIIMKTVSHVLEHVLPKLVTTHLMRLISRISDVEKIEILDSEINST